MRPQRLRIASDAARIATLTSLLAAFLSFSSCFVKKQPSYLQQGFDTTAIQQYTNKELTIQKGDHLNIMFYSDNPSATAIYNQSFQGESPAGSNRLELGGSLSRSMYNTGAASLDYVVDKDGNIRLHAIGTIRAEGHTRSSLEQHLTDLIKALGTLSNPYCLVRYSGFRITVLGEVSSPGVYSIRDERATLLEALGMAGDVLYTGLKNDVMRIREEDGRRTFKKLDLTSADLTTSPDYYVHQNDILIVQQDQRRQPALLMQRIQYVSMFINVLSVLILFLNLFR